MLKSNVCSLINLSDSYFQCCGARAAWSRHFKGGAGADFLFGPSREPEPPFLRRLRLYLFGKHKGKPCVVTKDDLKAVCNGCLLDPDPGGISLSGSMRIRIRNTEKKFKNKSFCGNKLIKIHFIGGLYSIFPQMFGLSCNI